MRSTKSLIFATLSLMTPAALSFNLQPSTLPTIAHCFGITYHADEILAAAKDDATLAPSSLQGFPYPYPLSDMKYAWPNHGSQFPDSGYPWVCGSTHNLIKYPLVPASITGRDGKGTAKPWDGSTTRSSNVGGGHTQSDFVFLDEHSGAFCLIATETPMASQGGWAQPLQISKTDYETRESSALSRKLFLFATQLLGDVRCFVLPAKQAQDALQF
ncbi:MAG: hypothetical protein Q9218_003522 [Villophora microphyllina]